MRNEAHQLLGNSLILSILNERATELNYMGDKSNCFFSPAAADKIGFRAVRTYRGNLMHYLLLSMI